MRFRDTDLSHSIRAELCPQCPERNFQKDEVIFLKGDTSNQIYFVAEGSAKAVSIDADGKSVFFMDYLPGDIFGYYAAFTKKPRTATLISNDDLKVCMIDATVFMQFLSTNQTYNETMMTYMAFSLRHNSLRLSRNATPSALRRISALLLYLMEESNSKMLAITNREDLASQLNLTRETLSRELNALARDKIITLAPTSIDITNPHALYKLISEESVS